MLRSPAHAAYIALILALLIFWCVMPFYCMEVGKTGHYPAGSIILKELGGIGLVILVSVFALVGFAYTLRFLATKK